MMMLLSQMIAVGNTHLVRVKCVNAIPTHQQLVKYIVIRTQEITLVCSCFLYE